jgi:hypothetical protein
MTEHDPAPKNTFDGPTTEPTFDEKLESLKNDFRQQFETLQTDPVFQEKKAKFKEKLPTYAVYAAVGLGSLLILRKAKGKKPEFWDLRVTKDQVAALTLSSGNLSVLYDTPFGQVVLAAVPPVEG